MIAVTRDAPGIGLAATQLGIVKRVIVDQVDDDPVTLAQLRASCEPPMTPRPSTKAASVRRA